MTFRAGIKAVNIRDHVHVLQEGAWVENMHGKTEAHVAAFNSAITNGAAIATVIAKVIAKVIARRNPVWCGTGTCGQ